MGRPCLWWAVQNTKAASEYHCMPLPLRNHTFGSNTQFYKAPNDSSACHVDACTAMGPHRTVFSRRCMKYA